MKHISAYSYQKLINLHRTRAKAASELIKPPRGLKCPQCNSCGHGSYGNPRWWNEFANKAKAELAVRPTTEGIFDNIEFLRNTCTSGCSRCPMSLLDSGPLLMDLKKQIDALPATIWEAQCLDPSWLDLGNRHVPCASDPCWTWLFLKKIKNFITWGAMAVRGSYFVTTYIRTDEKERKKE